MLAPPHTSGGLALRPTGNPGSASDPVTTKRYLYTKIFDRNLSATQLVKQDMYLTAHKGECHVALSHLSHDLEKRFQLDFR